MRPGVKKKAKPIAPGKKRKKKRLRPISLHPLDFETALRGLLNNRTTEQQRSGPKADK